MSQGVSLSGALLYRVGLEDAARGLPDEINGRVPDAPVWTSAPNVFCLTAATNRPRRQPPPNDPRNSSGARGEADMAEPRQALGRCANGQQPG
jgi:hypothetical protein